MGERNCDPHQWRETNRRGPHAGDAIVEYVKCWVCGAIGFRKPPSTVIYTWLQEP